MRLATLGVLATAVILAGCTGGAKGDPGDDIGDILILSHSPGNGDQLDREDSTDGFNALNNPTLTNPGAVTLVFTNSLNPSSVLNPDPSDPQGTRNVRLFYFDTSQGPFDPAQPVVLGANPPGANVIVNAQTVLTTTNLPNDTLIIRPTGISATNPLRNGQYSVTVELGVQGADGDGLKGAEHFFYFRVGQDNLGPVIVETSPASGSRNVDAESEIRITMSETILSSTVNSSTLRVEFQPAGAQSPLTVPGRWFTDGGNGPGNNFPTLQLDFSGQPGRSGVSPRNGADLVFRPDLDAFPVNMTAEDPNDPLCTLTSDPPRKGNSGLPLGQAVTVTFETVGIGVTDTVGNPVPAGSPNTTFTFFTRPLPTPVYAPTARGAVYYGDTVGVGVIDADPARTPYRVGPNPPRTPNSVVTSGTGLSQKVVRVPINDLVDITTDTRPWSSFYTFLCILQSPTIFMGNVYALSGSQGGGEVTVIDSFRMVPLGRFNTPSPGGIGLTAIGFTGRAAVSNFSANTVTVFDIERVRWYDGNALWASQAGLNNAVVAGNPPVNLILTEKDFRDVFPNQRNDVSSPPGPPIIGTINVGISPTATRITGLPQSLGFLGLCPSPVLSNNTIVISLNAGENTADFSELTNLSQSAAILPDLDGVVLSSQPRDVAWSPYSGGTLAYYFYIAGVGGTVELFETGTISAVPSVRSDSATNVAPNKIINSISGLRQPGSVQWITGGNGAFTFNGYTHTVLVAETGLNRLQQLAVTGEFPNLFQAVNTSHVAGLGPVDITGDPAPVGFSMPCGPRFTTYYVANAGEGTVRTSSYTGGVIGATIPVPGVLRVASWWSR